MDHNHEITQKKEKERERERERKMRLHIRMESLRDLILPTHYMISYGKILGTKYPT